MCILPNSTIFSASVSSADLSVGVCVVPALDFTPSLVLQHDQELSTLLTELKELVDSGVGSTLHAELTDKFQERRAAAFPPACTANVPGLEGYSAGQSVWLLGTAMQSVCQFHESVIVASQS